MLNVVLVQTGVQTGSCQGAGPVAVALPGMACCRANSVAPFVPSPPVAGKIPHGYAEVALRGLSYFFSLS